MFSSSMPSANSTRSFQNDPLPRKRLSADKKLLPGVTNLTEPPAKRQCSSKAQDSISQQEKKSDPRGDTVKGNQVRYNSTNEVMNDSLCTLSSIKRLRAHIFKDTATTSASVRDLSLFVV